MPRGGGDAVRGNDEAAETVQHAEGLLHRGYELCFGGALNRIDMHGLTGGKQVMVYGQTEVTRDLMAARAAAGLTTVSAAMDVAPHDFDGKQPRLTYSVGGQPHELRCDFFSGCDGYHGPCRASVPPSELSIFEMVYPFGWLGVLADTPPVAHELI